MRQLLLQVPHGYGAKAMEIARAFNSRNLACFQATNDHGTLDMVTVHVSNGSVEGILDALEELPELRVTLIPRGVMPLGPPTGQAPEQVLDVETRSPIEVLLAGLQSVGSWKGFLGYAVAAGLVVWIGLYTNTVYLLTAAMLIAPFAGPAMNTAIATARGDRRLLGSSLLRYFAALLVTIATTALLSLILDLQVATQQMVATSQVSIVAVLLPLVAGAAGALNLVQSERDSLVSGAAVGLLVAASLAPPAGLIGMATVLGRWDMVLNGLYVLLLQLVGINLAGALVFRLFGLSPRGARYARGRRWLFYAVLALTIAALSSLLYWQFQNDPDLERASRTQRATAVIQELVEASPIARLVEANVSFTGTNIEGQHTLLGVLYVQRSQENAISAAEIRSRLTQAIQKRLLKENFNVTPLIQVNVLTPPPD